MISALPGHIMARFHVPQTAQGDPRAQTAPPWRGSGGGGRGNGELLRETGRGVILGDRLSLLPGSRAGPGGLGSGAAPRDPRPGRCLWSRAGSRGESGGSAARRVRRGVGGGLGGPQLAARVWLDLFVVSLLFPSYFPLGSPGAVFQKWRLRESCS